MSAPLNLKGLCLGSCLSIGQMSIARGEFQNGSYWLDTNEPFIWPDQPNPNTLRNQYISDSQSILVPDWPTGKYSAYRSYSKHFQNLPASGNYPNGLGNWNVSANLFSRVIQYNFYSFPAFGFNPRATTVDYTPHESGITTPYDSGIAGINYNPYGYYFYIDGVDGFFGDAYAGKMHLVAANIIDNRDGERSGNFTRMKSRFVFSGKCTLTTYAATSITLYGIGLWQLEPSGSPVMSYGEGLLFENSVEEMGGYFVNPDTTEIPWTTVDVPAEGYVVMAKFDNGFVAI